MSYTPALNTILLGTPKATTATAGDTSLRISTTSFVSTAISDALTAGDFVGRTTAQTITGAKTFTGTAGNNGLKLSVTGDTQDRLAVDYNGTLNFGSGAAVSDVSISRTAANILSIGADDYLRATAAPVVDADLTNKGYVDAVATGLDVKTSVRATQAGSLPAYTRTGNVITASANGALSSVTFDGVTPIVGNRLLIAWGVSADNGIYEVTAVGDVSNPFVLTRTSDADNSSSGEVTSGMFTFVTEGTEYGDSGWVLATNDPIVLNTTALTFTQFSGAGQITAGTGLIKTGNVLDVQGTTNRIIANADSVDIASNYVGQTSLTTLGTITTGTWTGTAIAIANGGTGGTTLGGAQSNLDIVTLAGAQTIAGLKTFDGGLRIKDAGSAGFAPLTSNSNGDLIATGIMKASNFKSGNSGVSDPVFNAESVTATASGIAFSTQTGAEAWPFLRITGDHALSFGSGAVTTHDVKLTRSGAATLTITGKLSQNTAPTVGDDLTNKTYVDTAVSAAVAIATTTVTAAHTVGATDEAILVNHTAPITITLPADHVDGRVLHIKDISGSAETNNVTIDPADADLIDGQATTLITMNYQNVTVVSNGTNWYII